MRTFLNPQILEAGVDEAGRGPLFGRVYVGAVIWPPQLIPSVEIKDSKQYKNHRERLRAYHYIKQQALAYSVTYIEPQEIDRLNISQAVIKGMHQALDGLNLSVDHILVDGNYFEPYYDAYYDRYPDFTTVKQGDALYYSIAAASILAKVDHDLYIEELCNRYLFLDNYDLRANKGYGSPAHLQALQQYGATQFHRRSFNRCKQAKQINI